MLVLSRKTQESVVIGGAGGFEQLLKVKVLGISGDKVKLGFRRRSGDSRSSLGGLGTNRSRGRAQ